MKSKGDKKRLIEVMQRLDKTFKPKLNESVNNTDPTKEEMVNFLKNKFKGLVDFNDSGTDFDIESAIYWFASNYYNGQWSNLYSVLSTSQFKPGPSHRSIEDEESEIGNEMYNALANEYGGDSDAQFSDESVVPATEGYNKWSQSQDAWAEIEGGGRTERGKNLQKKVNLDKKGELGSGSGSSHVPEYYYSYDSEDAISNINNLTQGQIDAMNNKRRDSMEQDVRRSMSRGNGGWGMDENNEMNLPTKDGKSIMVSIPNSKEIFINGDPIEEILESVGDDEAVGNFPNGKINFNTYFDWITHRPGGVTEETFNNNRLFRVNIEYLVKAYDKYKEEEGIYENKNMKKDGKQRLFEVMGRVDPTFKPSAKLLREWNFDKKKDEDKEEGKESEEHEEKEKKETSGKKKWNFEKKEDKETKEHEESETPKEEREEHEDKKELDEVKPKTKIPVNMIAKVGGNKLKEGKYDYNDDDDPDAGHTVNGKLLSPEEYRKWKEEEGEYEPDVDRWRKRR